MLICLEVCTYDNVGNIYVFLWRRMRIFSALFIKEGNCYASVCCPEEGNPSKKWVYSFNSILFKRKQREYERGSSPKSVTVQLNCPVNHERWPRNIACSLMEITSQTDSYLVILSSKTYLAKLTNTQLFCLQKRMFLKTK